MNEQNNSNNQNNSSGSSVKVYVRVCSKCGTKCPLTEARCHNCDHPLTAEEKRMDALKKEREERERKEAIRKDNALGNCVTILQTIFFIEVVAGVILGLFLIAAGFTAATFFGLLSIAGILAFFWAITKGFEETHAMKIKLDLLQRKLEQLESEKKETAEKEGGEQASKLSEAFSNLENITKYL